MYAASTAIATDFAVARHRELLTAGRRGRVARAIRVARPTAARRQR
jgi:hypothetical protein